MNSHVPFDACQPWGNTYGSNCSNDPLVDKLIGNAYHVVRTVYCNLGNLKLIFDFLNQYGMVLGVQSETELKAMTTSASYVRLYGFDNTNKRVVTDYLYVEDDRTGVIPDDPNATGSWILVATSNSGGGSGGDEGKASSPYIPYTYNNGSAIGGETTIPVPAGTVGVPMIVVEGCTNLVGYGFTYDAASLTVTLSQPLEPGDEVHLFLTGNPAVPDNPNVTDWVQINWLYNGGYAVGGEQVIAIPYTFESVPAIYKNGERYYAGLANKSYTVDAANQRILLTEPLATNDRLIVTIGGETTTLIMSDRTIQEVARSANVKDSEVILSSNTTQYLNGMKVVYDVVDQKTYGLPALPTNIYINSVSNGQLTYSPGNITVDLLPVPDTAPELENRLYSSTEPGASLVMHSSGKTVEEMFNLFKYVFPWDDLKAVLENAEENETIMVVGDVPLNQSVTLTKAVSIDCSKGKILWSGTDSCIRFIPPVLQTYTTPVVFTGGQNHAQFPAGHTVEVGQMLCCYSNERRTGTSLGDYFRGQYLFVRKVTGQQVEFYPSVLEGFTSNKIEVRKPTANMKHYFRLKQITPVGTPGGVMLDMSYSLNCSGYVELDCNRDPNVGFGIGGHNHNFTFNIQGITNGATGYNVMGYGIGATGTRMHFEGTGSNCRHLVEIPSGSILSADIHFDINATKEVGNPLYLYIAGVHCNVLGWSLSGRISGSGGMVCDRSGTAHFKDLHFDCQDDGYDGYGCISVANLYPSQTVIENVTMTVSGDKRKTLVDWDIQGQGTQNGLLVIKNCITKGRCRILKLRDTGAGATTHTYRFRIEGCSGEAASIHNRDIASSNVYMELYNNTWSTYGLSTFPDYMAGSDNTGCKVYEVHSANNVFVDTNSSGVFSFDGYMDEIRFSSQADTNTTKPFIKLTPTYLGSVGRLDINGLSTGGPMTLTPTAATDYKDIGQVRFCKISYDSAAPITVGLSWPIVYTGNSFKTTLDATLVSTKRPQGGNVNLSGKALNWNNTNIAI